MYKQGLVPGHFKKSLEDQAWAAENERINDPQPCQDLPLCQKNKKDQQPGSLNQAAVLFLPVQIGFLSLGDVMHFDSAPSR